jgi:HK97 family phage major capsid protein
MDIRRIITRGVIDMATSRVLETDSYFYSGPWARCDGAADLAAITKSITEIGDAAKAGNVKVTEQLAAIEGNSSAMAARILDLEQKIIARGVGVPGPGGAAGAPDLGALVAKGINYDELKSRNAWLRVPVQGTIRNIMKSVLVNTGTSGGSPETGFPTVGEILQGGPFGFTHRRLSILAALTSVPVNTAKIDFPKLVSNTDAAAIQENEGDLKPETDLSFIMEILENATVASTLSASRQVLADSPLLVEFINQVLLFNTLKKFENLVVSGNGTTDKVSGLLTQGIVFVPPHGHAADMIGDTVASLQALGFTPNLIILNAFDYFKIISARDANGRYLAGGWSAASPTSLWGVYTVPTAALNSGTAIVMDTQVVRVLDREEANVQVGYINDDFARNKVTMLAELRGQLAVQNPDGCAIVSIPANSP